MKKLISLVLVLVLVFSLAVPSFAVGDNDTELDALNNIDYYVYWMFQDFTEKLEDLKTWNYQSMMQLLDINDFTRSLYSELDSLNNNLFGDSAYLEPLALTISNSLSSLEDSFNFFNDSFFDNVLWGEPFAEVVQDNLTAMAADLEHTYQLQQYLISDRWDFIEGTWWKSMYDDLHQLKEVLASDEDVLIRDNQNGNFSSAISTIFSGQSSSSSVGGNDIASVVGLGSYLSSAFSVSGTDENASTSFQDSLIYLNVLMSFYNLTEWFTESTKNSLVFVPMTYSRDSSNVVVTHYLQDNEEFLNSIFGGDFFD